jgi:hypothetical protein
MEEGGMLKVEQYEYVRTGYRVYGLSIAEFSRQTGHSRTTSRKVLQNELSGYQKRSYQLFPVLQGYMHLIDFWLEDDKEQHSKQRHTARLYSSRPRSQDRNSFLHSGAEAVAERGPVILLRAVQDSGPHRI